MADETLDVFTPGLPTPKPAGPIDFPACPQQLAALADPGLCVGTYVGGFTTVQIDGDSRLGSATDPKASFLGINGGTLRLTGNWTSARSITIDASGELDTQTNNATLSGPIIGSGSFNKIGAGTWTISGGDNTFTGTITLGDSSNAAGTLAFSGAGALNSASVTFGFGGGGIAGTYSLDFSGATAASGTPWRSLTALNTNSNFSLAHTVKLGASALAPVDLRVGSGTFGGTAGIITGFGKLVKVGPGTLTLNGATASTFTGGVEIWGGTLSISADSNLGNSANGISIMGGTLSLPFMGTGVTINRTITLGATTQPIISGNLSVSLNNTIASTNNDVINGTIQGPGGVDFSGVGNIVLGAASNTYQGDTQIRNAINLVFTSDAQLGAASSRIRLGNATLRLVANPGSLTTFITNRPIFLTDDSASTSGNLVVANSNATWQLNGPLWSASTLHELVFDGSGKLSIAGNNTSFLAPSRLVIPALRATCPWRPPASFAGAVWASRLLPSPRSTCRTSRGNLAICISAPAPPSPWARMAVSPRDSTTAGWGGTAKSPAVVQRR